MNRPLIALLDTLGRTPHLADLDARIAALDVDDATRAALIGRDAGALARAFGDPSSLWCLIVAPDDEPKPADDVPGDAPEREPDPQPRPDPAT